MCLAAIVWNAHPLYRAIIVANRDEYHARPTAALAPWEAPQGLLAGRDLQAGGTWFGVDSARRFGLVTNFRERARPRPNAPSRGRLICDFLGAAHPPTEFLGQLADESPGYSGFNLLLGDERGLWYASNRAEPFVRRLGSGVHVVSNHVLDTPWPKVQRLRQAVERWLAAGTDDLSPLWAALADRTQAEHAELPQTGLTAEWERLLSAAFIQHPEYGTRCSTVLLLGHDGRLQLEERSFDAQGSPAGVAEWRLRAQEWPSGSHDRAGEP